MNIYYEKIETEIIVHHRDIYETILVPGDVLTGKYDEPYFTIPQDIPGYELLLISDNAMGTFGTKKCCCHIFL